MQSPNSAEHFTVLLSEAVDALVGDAAGRYIDGTFGRGGHSSLIVERLSEQGRLLAIDKDEQAIDAAAALFPDESRFEIARASFADMAVLCEERQWQGKVDGVLLDLGVSSPQLDQAERGFSFMNDGPLDMRMDTSKGLSAAEWINTVDVADMIRVFRDYGEERFAKRIANAIVARREEQPFERTLDFAKVVAEANPAWEKNKNPATRVFQAVRICVNNELGDLESALEQALDMLAVGGHLVIISFHSLEDRIVKRFVKHHEKGDTLPKGVPVTDDMLNKRLKHIGKAQRASSTEIDENVRSRSAIMRVARKLK